MPPGLWLARRPRPGQLDSITAASRVGPISALITRLVSATRCPVQPSQVHLNIAQQFSVLTVVERFQLLKFIAGRADGHPRYILICKKALMMPSVEPLPCFFRQYVWALNVDQTVAKLF